MLVDDQLMSVMIDVQIFRINRYGVSEDSPDLF